MQSKSRLVEELTDYTLGLLDDERKRAKSLGLKEGRTGSNGSSLVASGLARHSRGSITTAIREILDPSPLKLTPELKIATVLIADIRGFTQLTASNRPTQIVALLNFFFTRMVELIYKYEGFVDKFMGDSVMAVFGLKNKRKPRRSSLDAVRCAAEMQHAMEDVNLFAARLGLDAVYIGVGLNCGEVVATTLGCESHGEYTVIGETVNTAARVEAHSLRGQVLLTAPLYSLVSRHVAVGEPADVFVKGQPRPIRIFELTSVELAGDIEAGIETPTHTLHIPRCDERKSPRVPVHLPMQYWRVEGSSIGSAVGEGEILDLGYYGMRARTSEFLEPFSNIKFPFSLAMASPTNHDIYAKVLRTSKDRNEYISSLEFTAIPAHCERSLHSFIDRTLA